MGRDMVEGGFTAQTSTALGKADRGRSLTHDEMKAAEAAFRGEPFNPAWSAAAAQIYGGILAAMAKRKTENIVRAPEHEPEYVRI